MRDDTSSARPAVVIDVLGTLVDQTGGLRRAVRHVVGVDDDVATVVVDRWLAHVTEQERAVVAGARPFAPSDVLDTEALARLVDEDVLPSTAVRALSAASTRLEPWPDSVTGLDLLATATVTTGLSNASRRVLAALSARAGLRWHQVLSAEDAGTYKPAPELYALATDSLAGPAGPPYMVAAHAWDLRAAAAVGMRTAYVPRPNGDAPRDGDAFDVVATSLADLHARLVRAA